MILQKIHKLTPGRIIILSILLYCCLLLPACSSGAGKVPTVNLVQDKRATRINNWGIKNVQQLLRMASVKQAEYYNEENARRWGNPKNAAWH